MNVERLHNLLHIINNDFSNLDISSVGNNFVNTFTQNIQHPTPENSQNFNHAQQKLKNALLQCDSNNFMPSQQKILQKIDGNQYIGVGLLEKFEKIMNENTLTPGDAVKEVEKHFSKTAIFIAAVEGTLDNFETLKIDSDYTKENEYEIGFLFPCKFFNNDLEGFQKEVNLINRLLVKS